MCVCYVNESVVGGVRKSVRDRERERERERERKEKVEYETRTDKT